MRGGNSYGTIIKEVVVLKDIPVFTTENGVASLVLQEIPVCGRAYIRLQAALEPEKLLDDCISFCRMVGASRVYASGNEILQSRPFHTAIWEMACLKDSIEDTDAALWPLQPETVDTFRELYNKKIATVPNAAWMTEKEVRTVQAEGEGYYIHREKQLLGIGIVSGGEIRFAASVFPGAGADVVRALAHAVCEARITLQVASKNKKAVSLYERMGFVKVREISRWYCVFEDADT